MRHGWSTTLGVTILVAIGLVITAYAFWAVSVIAERVASNQPVRGETLQSYVLLVRVTPSGGYACALPAVRSLSPSSLAGWDGILHLRVEYERSEEELPWFGIVRGPRPALYWTVSLINDLTGFRPQTDAGWRTLLEVGRDAFSRSGRLPLAGMDLDLAVMFSSPGVLDGTTLTGFPMLVGRVHLTGPTWDDVRVTISTIRWLAASYAGLVLVTLGASVRRRWLRRSRRRRGRCEDCGQPLSLGTARLLVCSECGADGRPAAARTRSTTRTPG